MPPTKNKLIHVRMEPKLKKDAENVLRQLGITPAEAIRMYFAQIILHNGMPFPVDLETNDTPDQYVRVKDDAHLKQLIGL